MTGNFWFFKSKLGELAVIAAQDLTFQFIIQLGAPVLSQVSNITIGEPLGQVK